MQAKEIYEQPQMSVTLFMRRRNVVTASGLDIEEDDREQEEEDFF